MIISTKIGQTSFISEEGKRFSATVLDYNSCSVVGNRTQEKDGYIANILGYLKPKKLNKPQLKDFNKKNIEPKKIIKEQRLLTEDNLLDIGSGAGFPGVVLSILTEHEIHLVESDRKKCAFLRTALSRVNSNASVHETRLEEMSSLRADIITARAFAPLPRLLALTQKQHHPKLRFLLLKGRDIRMIDSEKNEIVVGPREKLGKKIIHLKDLNLLVDKKDFLNDIFVKVRSTGKLLDAKIDFLDQDHANVHLKISEDGISPGQACVFYKKDALGHKVLGGGWIKN